MNENKTCPFCGEKIKSVAVKCKYCKSDLSNNNIDEIEVSEKNKSDEYVSSIKKYVLGFVAFFAIVFVALVINSETETKYLDQYELGKIVNNFTGEYTNAYQFLNEISATQVRNSRKIFLEKLPNKFSEWKVRFSSASTDKTGNAKVVFNDYYQKNLFYVAYLKPSDVGYSMISGKGFGTVFYITGKFKTNSTSSDYFVEESLTEKGAMLAPEFRVSLDKISEKSSADNINSSSNSELFISLIGKHPSIIFETKGLKSFIENNVGADNIAVVSPYFNVGQTVIREGNFIVGSGCMAGSCNTNSGIWVYDVNNDGFFLTTLDSDDRRITLSHYTLGDDVLNEVPQGLKLNRKAPTAYTKWLNEYGVSLVR